MSKLLALPAQAVYHLQVIYLKQSTADTIRITVPDSIGGNDLENALQKVAVKYGIEAYENSDSLEITETMLDEITDMFGGSWDYLSLLGSMEVNGYKREFRPV